MISTQSRHIDDFQIAFLNRFELGQIKGERVLNGGMFSRPVLLDCDAGLFVLRTHQFRSDEASFCFQAEAIAAAANDGIRCACVVQPEDGAWCAPVPDGIGVLALHEYVEGEVMDWNSWHQRSNEDTGFLKSLGRQVARLHNALANSRPRGDERLPIELPPIRLNQIDDVFGEWHTSMEKLRNSPIVNRSKASSQLLKFETTIAQHWSRLAAALQKHNISSVPTQIVHGDISPVNLVFDLTGECCFIDWDCVHVGHRAYDAIGDVLNRYPADHPDPNIFRADLVTLYLSGYSEVIEKPLSPQEQDLVPAFCLARQLEDLRQRLRVVKRLDAKQNEEYSELIRLRVEMMEQIHLN